MHCLRKHFELRLVTSHGFHDDGCQEEKESYDLNSPRLAISSIVFLVDTDTKQSRN